MQQDEPRLRSLFIPGFRDCHCSHLPFWVSYTEFSPTASMLPPPQAAGPSFPALLSPSLQQLNSIFLNAPLCSCFFFLRCLLFPLLPPMSNFHCTHSSISSDTPVISQVLQPLSHIHLVPIHQVPSPNFTWKWASSGCLPPPPNSKEFSGTFTKVFHTYVCFPKPPFPLLSECEEGLHYWQVGMSFLFPLPQLPSSHYTCRESSSSWGYLFICSASIWVAGH